MPIISRSAWRKLLATCIAIGAFVLFYEAATFDSVSEGTAAQTAPTSPTPGSRLDFDATAYCKGTITASGVGPRTGIAAADPSLLPVGSVVNVTTDDVKYNGIYTVMDTGPKIQGRLLDVYMWSCYEALAFGRKAIEVTVLRLGWNPQASTPSLIDKLFRRREASRRSQLASPAQDASTVAGGDSAAVPALNVSTAEATGGPGLPAAARSADGISESHTAPASNPSAEQGPEPLLRQDVKGPASLR